MPGIDSYTQLLLHCNGTDGSTSFPDASSHSRVVTAISDTQVDTAQSKFGGASAMFDGVDDYLEVDDFDELDLGSDDFTFDFWVRFNNFDNNQVFFCRYAGDGVGGYFYCAYESGFIRFRDYTSDVINTFFNQSFAINTWYHIAVVRYGNVIKFFIDGVQAECRFGGYDVSCTGSFTPRTSPLRIGSFGVGGSYPLNGYIDEFRFSKGIARWTSNFTPPSQEYSGGETADISETLSISDTWEPVVTGIPADVSDEIELEDTWELHTNPEQESVDGTLHLSDSWVANNFGSFVKKYATKLSTSLQVVTKYLTNLQVARQIITQYATKLMVALVRSIHYKTDLRIRVESYNAISIGRLDDFIVKLDGVELTDVDYTTLNISLNLNSTPSRCEFVLARHHDNLDEKLDTTPSVITNENKIEVYDKTIKLFTGYITEINAQSSKDTVGIVAEDIRYKFARISIELEYGGQWRQDSNSNGIPDEDDLDTTVINTPSFIKFEKNIATAISEVLGYVSSYLSGYDALPFSGSFVPEYIKTSNDCASFLDELLRNTANVNWYIDENERLRYQKVANGTLKMLNLASMNVHRHPYDTIINDIQMNHKPTNYARSLIIRRGKKNVQSWRRLDIGLTEPGLNLLADVKERINFGFQKFAPVAGNSWFYVGMNQTLYTYYSTNSYDPNLPGEMILDAKFIVQWKDIDNSFKIQDVVIGSGAPTKMVYLTSYNIKTANMRWEELKKEYKYSTGVNVWIETQPPEQWLTEVMDESYDYTDFALDLAGFELSQSNKLLTTANVNILLDAYEYYNLNFSDLINLGNTVKSNIYDNNNGFPLNIQGVQMNLGRRTVTLNLTNYGKSYYAKTVSILKNYQHPTYHYSMIKYPVQKFTQGI